PKDGETAKDEGSSGDPVADLQKMSDDLQKAVDDVFQPIKDADSLLESIGKLPADLKAAKSKVDPKKLAAELKKIREGDEPALDGVKAEEGEAKKMIQERIDKLKALVASVKNIDQAAKDLGQKIADSVPKAAAAVAKVLPKLEAKLKAPFGVSAEDKK